MKKCPFCAEEIQDAAIKCRFCGEFFDGTPRRPKPNMKWYHSTATIVFGLIILGPLALPLVWNNPKYNLTTKAVITLTVILVTIWLCYLMGNMYRRLITEINNLGLT